MAIANAPKYLVVILVVAAVALSATTLAVLNVNQNVGSNGNISTAPNIGVYADSACTTNLTSLNWGNIQAGSTTNQTIYVKNTGTGTMTLSMAISNWNPAEAGSHITLSWNKGGTILTAGQWTPAVLTLNVASDITGIRTFSNTITITGTI